MLKKLLVLGCIAAALMIMTARYGSLSAEESFHTPEELAFFRGVADTLPNDSNSFFWSSGKCAGCHGYDPEGEVSVDEDGNDVNVVDDWRSTMMANSARDPFWRAKVSHEILVNPSHQAELEDKCTSCHAPQGHHAAHMAGATHYSIADMLQDEVALDGVACSACHQQTADSIGLKFSGALTIGGNDSASYGPYFNMFIGPMNDFVGLKPEFGGHVFEGEFCASCHTLITQTVDLNGNPTGNDFVEQATYHEWVNSDYDGDGEAAQTCQGCHMPRLPDQVVISDNYDFLDGNSPFGLHDLVGGNVFMLRLLKDNILNLDLRANAWDFDSTITKTLDMLQNQTLELTLDQSNRTADTAYYSVWMKNKAGHKFPSGYPARRAYVEFVALDEQGDTLFKSGVLQSDYEVQGQNATYEPHYHMINSEDQVQIYEQVMEDVNGDVTTVLERADVSIKDNRLTPLGFTTTHFAYDTCAIYGTALTDTNFNRDDTGSEGSGTDEIFYHVPTNGYEGDLTVTARVYYQSAPPKWMEEMFSFSSTEIDTFRTMYDNADQSPILIMEAEHIDVSYSIGELPKPTFSVGPNPVGDGPVRVLLSSSQPGQLRVYNAGGQLVSSRRFAGSSFNVHLPEAAGVYLLEIEQDGIRMVQRVARR